MTETGTIVLMVAIGALLGAGLAYYLTQQQYSRRLLRITQGHTDELQALRLANDERLGKERQSFMDQLEKLRSDERISYQDASEQVRAEHSLQLKETVERYELKLKEQVESDLSVTVHPFVNTQTKKALFTNETQVEVGYKYQLFVRGLPCFEPHTVVVESSIEKEVDAQRLEMFKDKALELAETVANIKTGGAASKVITIAKAAVRVLK